MEENQNVVLCGANSYNQKYYLNRDFANLPETIRQELQILCVEFTEDIGGILTLEYEPDGSLILKTTADEGDYYYDEIGAGLKLHQLQIRQKELFESLELYYRVAVLKLPLSEEDEQS